MREVSARLPCPVCLGTKMEKVSIGPRRAVEVDHCRRCGGAWLEQGEVQRLRSVPKTQLWKEIEKQRSATPPRCHDCHALIGRGDERCASCGRSNLLDCPACDRPMRRQDYTGLSLDVCKSCRGVWFDHEELEAIWGASFDRALARRHLPAAGVGTAADAAGDVLFHTIFFAPELIYYGAHATGAAASAAANVIANLPGAVASTPEAASSAFEAVGEAAGSVFEVVVEIITGIFDSF